MEDIRVTTQMLNQRKNDTSFTDSGLFGPPKYKQRDVRDIWFNGMELGMREGLEMGSLEGQQIDISTSCKNKRHKEFYKKFLELANEYKCGIQYHPLKGMCVIDLERGNY